jgi:competence protein ComEA
MELDWEPIKNWFGFTRRERRSASILLVILFIIIVLRYSVPVSNITVENIQTGFSGIDSTGEITSSDTQASSELFVFDPNSASYDTLIKLGFASKEANTLIRFRNKGGKFKKPADIRKVYGVDSVNAEKLIPYIKVRHDSSDKTVIPSYQKKRVKLDINSCDSASLVDLPGIGPVLSGRIIKYRRLLGGFASTEQLNEVYGLPEETYDLIKERIYADSSAIIRIKINSADYKELRRIPYIEKYELSAILKYRELVGKITGIGDLVDNKLLTEEKAGKVASYLSFE